MYPILLDEFFAHFDSTFKGVFLSSQATMTFNGLRLQRVSVTNSSKTLLKRIYTNPG